MIVEATGNPATGIRLASDALSAPVSRWLVPILPQGEVWTWHFIAGLTLFYYEVLAQEFDEVVQAPHVAQSDLPAREGDRPELPVPAKDA